MSTSQARTLDNERVIRFKMQFTIDGSFPRLWLSFRSCYQTSTFRFSKNDSWILAKFQNFQEPSSTTLKPNFNLNQWILLQLTHPAAQTDSYSVLTEVTKGEISVFPTNRHNHDDAKYNNNKITKTLKGQISDSNEHWVHYFYIKCTFLF